MLKGLNVRHDVGTVPGTDLPSSAAGNEEDGGDDQRSYQEDGEDDQEEHVSILMLLSLEWDLLIERLDS